jgi:hypothetical protein
MEVSFPLSDDLNIVIYFSQRRVTFPLVGIFHRVPPKLWSPVHSLVFIDISLCEINFVISFFSFDDCLSRYSNFLSF